MRKFLPLAKKIDDTLIAGNKSLQKRISDDEDENYQLKIQNNIFHKAINDDNIKLNRLEQTNRKNNVIITDLST